MSSSTSVSTQAQIGIIITLPAGEIGNLSPSLTPFSCALLDNCYEMQMLWNICQVQPKEKLTHIYIFISIYINSREQTIILLCYETTNSYTSTCKHTRKQLHIHTWCYIIYVDNEDCRGGTNFMSNRGSRKPKLNCSFQIYKASLCTLTPSFQTEPMRIDLCK